MQIPSLLKAIIQVRLPVYIYCPKTWVFNQTKELVNIYTYAKICGFILQCWNYLIMGNDTISIWWLTAPGVGETGKGEDSDDQVNELM
jgi:hypothetical protein